jgi:hypothetical protein
LLALAYVAFLLAIVIVADSGRFRSLFIFVDHIPFGDKIGHFAFMGTLALVIHGAFPRLRGAPHRPGDRGEPARGDAGFTRGALPDLLPHALRRLARSRRRTCWASAWRRPSRRDSGPRNEGRSSPRGYGGE